MKKFLSAAIAMSLGATFCFNGITTKTAQAAYIYENITQEVLQIISYIDDQMYLEAIKLCENTKYYRYLSQEDKVLLDDYRDTAVTAYNEYLKREENNITTQPFYVFDWCMGYEFFSAHAPEYYDEYIDIYDEDNAWITIESLKVGDSFKGVEVKSPSHYVTLFGKSWKSNFNFEGYNSSVEVLSENDTTVGDLPARQVTLRGTIDMNRYGTVKEYTTVRCTAFQFGGWIYVIKASENEYNWSDDFWNKMELVRRSISFY